MKSSKNQCISCSVNVGGVCQKYIFSYRTIPICPFFPLNLISRIIQTWSNRWNPKETNGTPNSSENYFSTNCTLLANANELETNETSTSGIKFTFLLEIMTNMKFLQDSVSGEHLMNGNDKLFHIQLNPFQSKMGRLFLNLLVYLF